MQYAFVAVLALGVAWIAPADAAAQECGPAWETEYQFIAAPLGRLEAGVSRSLQLLEEDRPWLNRRSGQGNLLAEAVDWGYVAATMVHEPSSFSAEFRPAAESLFAASLELTQAVPVAFEARQGDWLGDSELAARRLDTVRERLERAGRLLAAARQVLPEPCG